MANQELHINKKPGVNFEDRNRINELCAKGYSVDEISDELLIEASVVEKFGDFSAPDAEEVEVELEEADEDDPEEDPEE
jgi:hypothetical protein